MNMLTEKVREIKEMISAEAVLLISHRIGFPQKTLDMTFENCVKYGKHSKALDLSKRFILSREVLGRTIDNYLSKGEYENAFELEFSAKRKYKDSPPYSTPDSMNDAVMAEVCD